VKRRVLVAFVALAALAAAAVTALLVNIIERQQEARDPFFNVTDLTDEIEDPAVWGRNFPLQYEAYQQTVDQQRTRYGGSEALPRTPTEADPRSVVARSLLEADPRLRRMWAGYPFAVDAREKRGHAFMLEDQTYTQRVQQFGQPGTCLHCHASIYVPSMRAGRGDLVRGFDAISRMPFDEARKLVSHPVACIDCHDPRSMRLRITRPGFLEGIRALKAAGGIADYDPNLAASRQEMRSFVCAQCHVEYYFKGPDKRLAYPWGNGLTVGQIADYYDTENFSDWTHALTSAPTLKAQHPEFEMWSQGTHGRSGVACADCHMPYNRVGARKVSDHRVRSPLLSVNESCQTCHRWSEAELVARAERIQEQTLSLRNRAMDALMALIDDIEAARQAGATETSLDEARRHQRRGQFFVDFVGSENSTGFHAPQEAARILAESIDHFRLGQVSLRLVRTPR
jgi:nitrite reductase (cytochrome c-552)